MKKNYYYLFGSITKDIEDINKLLYDKLDLEFQPHESSYVGEYLKYSGMYADKITIERNFNKLENDWKEKNFQQYPTLIYVSNINGKNADKLSKSMYLKNALTKLEDISLLREDLIEVD
jgi:hypothetical protein